MEKKSQNSVPLNDFLISIKNQWVNLVFAQLQLNSYKFGKNMLIKPPKSAKKTVKGPVGIDGTLFLSRVLAGHLRIKKERGIISPAPG